MLRCPQGMQQRRVEWGLSALALKPLLATAAVSTCAAQAPDMGPLSATIRMWRSQTSARRRPSLTSHGPGSSHPRPVDLVRLPLAIPDHCSADGSLLPKQRRGTSLRLTSGFPTFCTNSLAHGSWFPISLRSELWYKADAACSHTTCSTLILAPVTSDYMVLPSG